MAGGSPVINLVNGLIQRAVRDGVSDIHIESGRSRSLVRFRIDGLLYEALSTRADMHPAIVSRLKVMANLDIAERRLPQDGRMQVTYPGSQCRPAIQFAAGNLRREGRAARARQEPVHS